MSLRNNEQRVLDAIENQLQAEEPQLADCFSRFGGKSPRIKPVDGWDQAASAGEGAPPAETESGGRHQDRDRHPGAIGTQVVLLIIGAMILVGFVVGVASWMRAR